MFKLVEVILQINQDVTRTFQCDYLIFDSVFLAVYIGLLALNKRYRALQVGLAWGALIYIIDGVAWSAAGAREYALPEPWLKGPTDLMMDVSYGIVAFSWMWIALQRESLRIVAFWTLVVLAGWMLTPLASVVAHIDDRTIMTIRHSADQVFLQIGVVFVGYLLLLLSNYDWKTILYVLWVGAMAGFMMEASLSVFGIRTPDFRITIYGTFFLFNQGAPYLFMIQDKYFRPSRQLTPDPAGEVSL